MPLDDRLKTALTVALDDARHRLESELDTELDAVRQDAARQVEEARAQTALAQEAAVHAAVTAARAEAQEAARAMAERTRSDTEMLLQAAVAEAEARAGAARDEAMAAAGIREREAQMSGASRILESVRQLDQATSLTEVLDRLTQSAAQEAGRAAVLVLRGDHLHGWKLEGFGELDAAPRQVDLAVVDAGVIGAAVAAAQPVVTGEDGGHAGPVFSHLPTDRMGLAVPVIVGGRVVAVVYADGARGGEHPVVPSPWPEMVELLARHAARCLEALTVQKAGSQAAKAAPAQGLGRPA